MNTIPFEATDAEVKILDAYRRGAPLGKLLGRRKPADLLALWRCWLHARRAALRNREETELIVMADIDMLEFLRDRHYPLASGGDLKAAATVRGLIQLKHALEADFRDGKAPGETLKPQASSDLAREQVALANARLQQLRDEGHDDPEIRAAQYANDLFLAGGA